MKQDAEHIRQLDERVAFLEALIVAWDEGCEQVCDCSACMALMDVAEGALPYQRDSEDA